MEEHEVDIVFREKLGNIPGLPSEVNWNSEKGWEDYKKQYQTRSNSGRSLFLWISSAAAALLLILFSVGIFQFHHHEMKQVNNNTSEIMEIVLPDSNRVWLNKLSTVEYPSEIDKRNNEFSVNGEAYFEFRKLHNPTYTIKAQNAVIVVENACAFNVKARKQEENVDITVAMGALKIKEVSYTEGLALLVTEGNYCSVHKSQNLVYSTVNRNENFLAWKTGKLIFNSMPVATVTDILAEYYQTQIELEDKSLAYCLFSGTFNDQSIDIILHQMQTDLNFVIRQTGDNKIMISGNACF